MQSQFEKRLLLNQVHTIEQKREMIFQYPNLLIISEKEDHQIQDHHHRDHPKHVLHALRAGLIVHFHLCF